MVSLLFKAENQSEHKRRSIWLSIVFNIYNEDSLHEAFFNLTYLGRCYQNLIQGIATASKCMLNKKVNDLTIAEIAYFAVIVRAPSRFLRNHKITKSKRDALLKKVHSSEKISSNELELALSEKIPKA